MKLPNFSALFLKKSTDFLGQWISAVPHPQSLLINVSSTITLPAGLPLGEVAFLGKHIAVIPVATLATAGRTGDPLEFRHRSADFRLEVGHHVADLIVIHPLGADLERLVDGDELLLGLAADDVVGILDGIQKPLLYILDGLATGLDNHLERIQDGDLQFPARVDLLVVLFEVLLHPGNLHTAGEEDGEGLVVATALSLGGLFGGLLLPEGLHLRLVPHLVGLVDGEVITIDDGFQVVAVVEPGVVIVLDRATQQDGDEDLPPVDLLEALELTQEVVQVFVHDVIVEESLEFLHILGELLLGGPAFGLLLTIQCACGGTGVVGVHTIVALGAVPHHIAHALLLVVLEEVDCTDAEGEQILGGEVVLGHHVLHDFEFSLHILIGFFSYYKDSAFFRIYQIFLHFFTKKNPLTWVSADFVFVVVTAGFKHPVPSRQKPPGSPPSTWRSPGGCRQRGRPRPR